MLDDYFTLEPEDDPAILSPEQTVVELRRQAANLQAEANLIEESIELGARI